MGVSQSNIDRNIDKQYGCLITSLVYNIVSTNTAEKALETIQAGKATTQESNNTVAEEAKDSNHVQCDLCDSEFRNTRGLKAHKGRVHKNISQMDGFIEEQDLDENCVFTFESTYA